MTSPALRFPRPLRPGDRIGVTSPSAGASGEARTRIDFSVEWLRSRGYDVVVGECMDGSGLTSAPAEQRAAELTRMLADPAIACVVPPWGGETAIDLIDLLDWDVLAAGAEAPVVQRDSGLVAGWVRFEDDPHATRWAHVGDGRWEVLGGEGDQGD